ncbi:sulfatase-like hydrolase/transferase [Pleomorphovibrio marinus]|uniref:sulfatase-like hydrolase/transferase n=1 Tax=Pleomorphovibrio marinus TaxID=2164132 RepID=UPI000E0C6218|nr:sulfatase-like hydrolase/transferase [Pleomorphovibrio marinus]
MTQINPNYRFFLLVFMSLVYLTAEAQGNKLPNIVFLISEDNSTHFMDLWNEQGVSTPYIAGMADIGVVYEHAFSNSPVCSVARSTLITGTYAPRTGIHLHRKIREAPMPEGLKMFPVYLREAGYYTTNKAKKDYNAKEDPGVWDESSNHAGWENRADSSQPFFHKETFMDSHESRLHFSDSLMEAYQPQDHPDEVNLFPMYPDTPTFRFTTAYHRDKIRGIDKWVGEVLEKLEKDGKLEDTFVFYFGDHGGVLPGSKGYLYETGLHIPLVVRIPENYRHLIDQEKGTKEGAFVSFMDFAPTVLHLAGIKIPAQMDGKPFLGKGLKADLANRDESVGYADRFDEKYEMVRSLRKGKWKYIRSFQPFYPDALHNNYRYQMLAFSEWRELEKEGKLNELQSRFFNSKPTEMLFNLEDDPFEINNLAEKEEWQGMLIQLRQQLNRNLLDFNDLGFLPEHLLVAEAMDNPVAYGESFRPALERIIEINDFLFLPKKEAVERLDETLKTGGILEQYWAINTSAILGDTSLEPTLKTFIRDGDYMLQWKAIECLGVLGTNDPISPLITLINKVEDPVLTLQLLNSLVYFRDHSSYELDIDVNRINPKNPNAEVIRRMDYFKGSWK